MKRLGNAQLVKDIYIEYLNTLKGDLVLVEKTLMFSIEEETTTQEKKMTKWEDMTDEERSREIVMAMLAGVSINIETGEVK